MDERYLIENEKGYVVAVFMYEHSAETYQQMMMDEHGEEVTISPIAVEDIHDYM